MAGDAVVGAGVIVLLLSFPFGLLAAIWGLAALERWMVTPTEKAAAVAKLLDTEDPDAIERAVTSLLANNADRPGSVVQTSRERRRRALKKLGRAEKKR